MRAIMLHQEGQLLLRLDPFGNQVIAKLGGDEDDGFDDGLIYGA